MERWFGLITQQAIRRGSFRSVRELVARINQFVQHYNRNCRPFAWPAAVLADSGYCSEENLREAAGLGVEAFIAVDRHKHNQPLPPAPRGPIPRSATLRDRMRRKLQNGAGSRIYAERKIIVEPVYGQIKQARGFRQFLLRGLEKVRGEWSLVCTGHNLLKLHRACTA